MARVLQQEDCFHSSLGHHLVHCDISSVLFLSWLFYWDVCGFYQTQAGIITELDASVQLIFMSMELILIIIMELLLTAEAVDLVFLFITGHRTMEIQMSCFRLSKWETLGEILWEWR